MSPVLEGSTTRRTFLGAGALGALAIGVAACGGGGSASAISEAKGLRTVRTAKGPVKVPAEPTRVVSIQPSTANTLYDLGIDPIGVYDLGGEYVSPRYRARWNKAAKVGDDGEISVEKVAALEPDLIIGADYEWNTDVYGKLKEIAPTVITPATGWREISTRSPTRSTDCRSWRRCRKNWRRAAPRSASSSPSSSTPTAGTSSRAASNRATSGSTGRNPTPGRSSPGRVCGSPRRAPG